MWLIADKMSISLERKGQSKNYNLRRDMQIISLNVKLKKYDHNVQNCYHSDNFAKNSCTFGVTHCWQRHDNQNLY